MEPQDSLITSTEDYFQNDISSVTELASSPFKTRNKKGQKKKMRESKKKLKKGKFKSDSLIQQFYKSSTYVSHNSDVNVLLNLLETFNKYVEKEVLANFPKPIRCCKLKTKMVSVLVFFNSLYKKLILMPTQKDQYFKKMSVFTAIYIEMEIKASRRGQEAKQKIAHRLITLLFRLFRKSPEYLLDTVLKTQFMKRCYKEICTPIFKAVTALQAKSDDMNYVRFLLIFKLWKLVVLKEDERNSINRLAVNKLSPPPPLLLKRIEQGVFLKVLPAIPNDKQPELITRFYMTSKFKLRRAINAFMEVEKEIRDKEYTNEFAEYEEMRVSGPSDVNEPKSISENIKTDQILEKLWTKMKDSSSAAVEANGSSCITSSTQHKVSSKLKCNKIDFFGDIIGFRMKTGKRNEEVIQQKKTSREVVEDRLKSLCSITNNNNGINTNTKVSSQALENVHEVEKSNFFCLPSKTLLPQTKNIRFAPEEDSSLKVCDDQDSDKPMTLPTSSVQAKNTNNKNIQVVSNQNNELVNTTTSNGNMITSKSKTLKPYTESHNSKSNLVPQLAVKEVLSVAKSQTSPTDLHIKTNDTGSSDLITVCNPNDDQTASDHTEVNLNPNLNVIVDQQNTDYISVLQLNHNQKVNTASVTRGNTDGLFRLLELDHSLVREDSVDEDGASSSEEYKDMSSEEESCENYKKSGSGNCSKYSEANIISQNPSRMNESIIVSRNPLTDWEAGSVDTSNSLNCKQTALFSQKEHANTGSICETTFPSTVASNALEKQSLCIVADSEINLFPKSESTRTDCMFAGSNQIVNQTDYSIDALLKDKQVQTHVKSEQVENCIFQEGITDHYEVKQGFSSNRRESPLNSNQPFSVESNSIPNLNSQTETYESQKEDDINQRLLVDNRKDLQERVLTKTPSLGLNVRELHERFQKNCLLIMLQNKNSLKECEERETLMSKGTENNISNDKTLRGEFVSSSVTQQESLNSKNWCPPTSYAAEKHNFNNTRVCYKQLKTVGFTNSSPNMEGHQMLRFLPHQVDVNKIELQVQAQNNIFTGDDDCESEGSNLVIDEDHDPAKESNEADENTCFVLKDLNGLVERKITIPELFSGNLRKSKLIHPLQCENTIYARMIPENVTDIESNRSSPRLLLNDNVFSNSYISNNVISSCESSDRFYHHENRTFIPRSMYIMNEVNSNESLENSPGFSSQNGDNSILIQNNISKCSPVEQIENINSGLPQNQRLHHQVQFPHFQMHSTGQISSNSFSPMHGSLHSLRESSAPLSEEFNNFNIYEKGDLNSYYCPGRNKLLLTKSNNSELNQPVLSPSSTYQGFNNHIQPCERPSLVPPDFHNSSMEYNPHEGRVVYMPTNQTDYLSTPEIQQFSHSQGLVEGNEPVRQKENMLNKSDSITDPLCLVVSNKEQIRDIGIDFACFEVGQEIEVSSAVDVGQNDLYNVNEPNEVEDSNGLITVEHGVTDTSNLSQPPDQLLYSAKKTNKPVSSAIVECNNPTSVNSFELQKILESVTCPNVDVSNFNKDKFNLHVKTLDVDSKLCSSQREFKEYYLSQEVPPAIPVPFPVQNRSDKPQVRCVCEQCSDNNNKLLNNYSMLTNFRNSKVKPPNVSTNEMPTCDKDQITEADCNLPLKKRKTLTSPKNSEETNLTSYPSTPMISIAQLEIATKKPQKQVVVSKTQKSQASCPIVEESAVNLVQSRAPKQIKASGPVCTRRRSTRKRKSTRG